MYNNEYRLIFTTTDADEGELASCENVSAAPMRDQLHRVHARFRGINLCENGHHEARKLPEVSQWDECLWRAWKILEGVEGN